MRSLAVIAAFAAASALDLSAPAIHHDLVNEINQAGLTWKAGACHAAHARHTDAGFLGPDRARGELCLTFRLSTARTASHAPPQA
jgi:hypothetical protein